MPPKKEQPAPGKGQRKSPEKSGERRASTEETSLLGAEAGAAAPRSYAGARGIQTPEELRLAAQHVRRIGLGAAGAVSGPGTTIAAWRAQQKKKAAAARTGAGAGVGAPTARPPIDTEVSPGVSAALLPEGPASSVLTHRRGKSGYTVGAAGVGAGAAAPALLSAGLSPGGTPPGGRPRAGSKVATVRSPRRAAGAGVGATQPTFAQRHKKKLLAAPLLFLALLALIKPRPSPFKLSANGGKATVGKSFSPLATLTTEGNLGQTIAAYQNWTFTAAAGEVLDPATVCNGSAFGLYMQLITGYTAAEANLSAGDFVAIERASDTTCFVPGMFNLATGGRTDAGESADTAVAWAIVPPESPSESSTQSRSGTSSQSGTSSRSDTPSQSGSPSKSGAGSPSETGSPSATTPGLAVCIQPQTGEGAPIGKFVSPQPLVFIDCNTKNVLPLEVVQKIWAQIVLGVQVDANNFFSPECPDGSTLVPVGGYQGCQASNYLNSLSSLFGKMGVKVNTNPEPGQSRSIYASYNGGPFSTAVTFTVEPPVVEGQGTSLG